MLDDNVIDTPAIVTTATGTVSGWMCAADISAWKDHVAIASGMRSFLRRLFRRFWDRPATIRVNAIPDHFAAGANDLAAIPLRDDEDHKALFSTCQTISNAIVGSAGHNLLETPAIRAVNLLTALIMHVRAGGYGLNERTYAMVMAILASHQEEISKSLCDIYLIGYGGYGYNQRMATPSSREACGLLIGRDKNGAWSITMTEAEFANAKTIAGTALMQWIQADGDLPSTTIPITDVAAIKIIGKPKRGRTDIDDTQPDDASSSEPVIAESVSPTSVSEPAKNDAESVPTKDAEASPVGASAKNASVAAPPLAWWVETESKPAPATQSPTAAPVPATSPPATSPNVPTAVYVPMSFSTPDGTIVGWVEQGDISLGDTGAISKIPVSPIPGNDIPFERWGKARDDFEPTVTGGIHTVATVLVQANAAVYGGDRQRMHLAVNLLTTIFMHVSSCYCWSNFAESPVEEAIRLLGESNQDIRYGAALLRDIYGMGYGNGSSSEMLEAWMKSDNGSPFHISDTALLGVYADAIAALECALDIKHGRLKPVLVDLSTVFSVATIGYALHV